MRKEAVMIVSVIVAVLAMLGVVVTPEMNEAIEAVVVFVLPIVLGYVARSQVFSKDTVAKEFGSAKEEQLNQKAKRNT